MNDTYRTCWTIESWLEVLREAADHQYIGLDFETAPNIRRAGMCDNKAKGAPSALRTEDGAQICGVSLAWTDSLQKPIRSAYIGIRHDHKHAGGKQPSAYQVLRALGDFIRELPPSKLIVVHNLMMELMFMLGEGIPWPKPGQLHDIQIAARVLNKGVGWQELIGLKPLQREVLKRDMSSKNDLDRWLKRNHYKPGADIWRAPVALAGWYAQDDSRDTLEIFLRWKDLIYQEPTRWWWSRAPNRLNRRDLYEMEIEAGINATRSAAFGTRFDLKLCKRQAPAAEVLQSVCRRWIRDYLDMPTVNPGSATQMRGILFGSFGFKPELGHMTKAFKDLRENDQAKTIAGQSKKPLSDYASLDVAALDVYAAKYPEHADLLFIMGVYRKCNTAIAWFRDRVLEFGTIAASDPWWPSEEAKGWYNIMYHRLRTVGTRPGRMSSSDYNAQQVPKRFKMLLNAVRLFAIMSEFLPESQFDELVEMLTISKASAGDEAKVLGVEPDADVVDFSVRRMFIPRDGYNMRLWDLSQVEFRGFAHFSNNPMLCGGYGDSMDDEQLVAELDYIRWLMGTEDKVIDTSLLDLDRHLRMEASPFDIHQAVADEMDIARKPAKNINFGMLYGMGQKKLVRSLGWGPAKGRAYLRRYHDRLPEIRGIQGKIKAALRERGYIFDPYGRRYYLTPDRAYIGLNRLVQGWAASTFKVGFVRVSELFSSPGFGAGSIDDITGRRTMDGARVLTCIHDELMSEVHKELDDARMDWAVRSCMTAFFNLNVPLGSSSDRAIPNNDSLGSWDEAVEVHAEAFTA